ncbi:MAG: PilZ domain-containing protein [Candidatus Omnitrophica bacterium]|nr:PilZ domain-containing protein [Candidatus Omnitrophota bacterium]MBU4346188.1 PilZ domain-containing protein [Candidatus Omnitrophota bacterium]
MEDRRVFARIDVKFPLRFLEPGSGREGEAEAVDISANGVGFIGKEKLAAKTPLEMWLEIPDHHAPFYTRGEVVWSSKDLTDTESYRAGVRLEKAELMGLARTLWVKRPA